MHVIHSCQEKRIDEHAHHHVGFLITNKKGNYLSLGEKNFSHMQGLFFLEQDSWEMFKTIEDLKLMPSQQHDKLHSDALHLEVTAIKNNLHNVQRVYKNGAEESFNLFNNSLMYSVKNYTGELVLELDFRAMFDYSEWGRIYSIETAGATSDVTGDVIVIRYDKYTDASLANLGKTRFLAIKGAQGYKKIGEWIKKDYAYDLKRGCNSEFYVYKALSLNVNNCLSLVFSFADTKEKAVEHAEKGYDNMDYLVSSAKKYVMHTFTSQDIALNVAMKALDDLLISIDRKERGVGIIAGLPWFSQVWARDELISLKALMIQEKYSVVKSILFKYLGNISEDGLVSNKFPSLSGDRKSIDSVGWLFFRIKEYIELLIDKKIMNEHLLVQDLVSIKRALENAIHGLAHHHAINGLIFNNEQETWMDTSPAKRSGACIEIQALFLSMLNLHNNIASLTKSKPLFKSLEKEQKELVRKEFFKQGTLLDCVSADNISANAVSADIVGADAKGNAGVNENTFDTGLSKPAVRPNIFLAYYIYPDLLSKKEWKQAFDSALKELWLGWGGLSTLSHSNMLFKSEYTGQNDESYHNGDSWYYVNNYAALAMYHLDKEAYDTYIKRIVAASKEELLFSGLIGCCAELSSAKHMRSEGCLSQAWSNASFIELMHELHD